MTNSFFPNNNSNLETLHAYQRSGLDLELPGLISEIESVPTLHDLHLWTSNDYFQVRHLASSVAAYDQEYADTLTAEGLDRRGRVPHDVYLLAHSMYGDAVSSVAYAKQLSGATGFELKDEKAAYFNPDEHLTAWPTGSNVSKEFMRATVVAARRVQASAFDRAQDVASSDRIPKEFRGASTLIKQLLHDADVALTNAESMWQFGQPNPTEDIVRRHTAMTRDASRFVLRAVMATSMPRLFNDHYRLAEPLKLLPGEELKRAPGRIKVSDVQRINAAVPTAPARPKAPGYSPAALPADPLPKAPGYTPETPAPPAAKRYDPTALPQAETAPKAATYDPAAIETDEVAAIPDIRRYSAAIVDSSEGKPDQGHVPKPYVPEGKRYTPAPAPRKRQPKARSYEAPTDEVEVVQPRRYRPDSV